MRLRRRPKAEQRRVDVVEHAELTDVGQEREHNEDSLYSSNPVFAVADGMGGAAAGEVASGMAVDAVRNAHRDGDLPDRMVEVVQETNSKIHASANEDRDLSGMGAPSRLPWSRTARWCLRTSATAALPAAGRGARADHGGPLARGRPRAPRQAQRGGGAHAPAALGDPARTRPRRRGRGRLAARGVARGRRVSCSARMASRAWCATR